MNLIEIVEHVLEKKKTENGSVKFKTIVLETDKLNHNKRIYPKKVIETEIARVKGKLKNSSMWGGDRHPEVSLEADDVSHRVDDIWLENNKLWISGEIIPTRRGKDLLKVLNAGSIGMSVRGSGETKPNAEGNFEVQEGYQLHGVDFVLNPSFDIAKISKANLFESAEFVDKKVINVDLRRYFYEAQMSGYKGTFNEYKALTEKFFSMRSEIDKTMKDKFGKDAWVEDFSKSEIIFRKPVGAEGKDKLFKVGYKTTGIGIELVGDESEVERQVDFK